MFDSISWDLSCSGFRQLGHDFILAWNLKRMLMLTIQTAEEIYEKKKQILNSCSKENQSGLDQFAIFKLWCANIPQKKFVTAYFFLNKDDWTTLSWSRCNHVRSTCQFVRGSGTKFMNRFVKLSTSLKPMCLPDLCWFSSFLHRVVYSNPLYMQTHDEILLYSCVGGLDEVCNNHFYSFLERHCNYGYLWLSRFSDGFRFMH